MNPRVELFQARGDIFTPNVADGPDPTEPALIVVHFGSAGCVALTDLEDVEYVSLDYVGSTDTLLFGDVSWHRVR